METKTKIKGLIITGVLVIIMICGLIFLNTAVSKDKQEQLVSIYNELDNKISILIESDEFPEQLKDKILTAKVDEVYYTYKGTIGVSVGFFFTETVNYSYKTELTELLNLKDYEEYKLTLRHNDAQISQEVKTKNEQDNKVYVYDGKDFVQNNLTFTVLILGLLALTIAVTVYGAYLAIKDPNGEVSLGMAEAFILFSIAAITYGVGIIVPLIIIAIIRKVKNKREEK